MKNYLDGFWNGEPAKFRGVIYEVVEPDIKTWWFAQFVGKRRQGIEIEYGNQTWIIDNKHGDGFYKVTKGLGSPRVGHKSTGGATSLYCIPENEINKAVDVQGLKKEKELHDSWMKENHPKEHEKSKALKELISRKRF